MIVQIIAYATFAVLFWTSSVALVDAKVNFAFHFNIVLLIILLSSLFFTLYLLDYVASVVVFLWAGNRCARVGLLGHRRICMAAHFEIISDSYLPKE